MPRPDGRANHELRPVRFDLQVPSHAAGAVLASMGQTVVLCTCCVAREVPEWLLGSGKGWLTAEYAMLPGSTLSRKARDRSGRVDGRSVEIQRLIGRSLRSVINLENLGERTLWVDCDVIRADGGTRTTAINGAYLAVLRALLAEKSTIYHPLRDIITGGVAAVSVGLVDGETRLDLDYLEDKDADVDMNLVMTTAGRFIEVQAGGEEATFSSEELGQLVELGKRGIREIMALQRAALSAEWPLD